MIAVKASTARVIRNSVLTYGGLGMFLTPEIVNPFLLFRHDLWFIVILCVCNEMYGSKFCRLVYGSPRHVGWAANQPLFFEEIRRMFRVFVVLVSQGSHV